MSQTRSSMFAHRSRDGASQSHASTPSSGEPLAAHQLRDLPVESIKPSGSQPRHHFDETALQALAGSLSERGVLQPILVHQLPDGSYELIAGERRWRAAQIAGLARIPALICALGDAAALEIALIENMARADLSPIEEARACVALVQGLGLTREEVGLRVGRSRVAVSNLMRLLELPQEILDVIDRGELSEGHGRALLIAEDRDVRTALAREAVAEGWSVRTLESCAREHDGGAASASKAARGKRWHDDPDELGAVARAWGEALGVEVRARTSYNGRLRLDVVYSSVQAALAAARRLHVSERGAPDEQRDVRS